MIPIDLTKLQLHELEELQTDVEDAIRNRKYDDWKAKKLTTEQKVALFTHFGITVPKGAVIWRVSPRGDKFPEGGYGMEVGAYEHSCHIDTTDFKVLYVVSANGVDHDVQSMSDTWLTEKTIV
jgi:hypothetical protein